MYKEVYEKLDIKKVEKDIYRIAQIRKRKIKDLCTVRYVKDEDQKVLDRDEEIKKDGERILINCSMIVLLKIWMALPFSTKI